MLLSGLTNRHMEYSADDIVQYENDVAACRARPTLYVGQDDTVDCVSTMLQEALSMALQSVMDDVATAIRITRHLDGRIELRDNGPTHNPLEVRDGVSLIELMLTQFAACNDAREINRSYFNFGIVSANALSKHFLFEMTHDGQLWRQEFRCGLPVSAVKSICATNEHFRRICFDPDVAILPNSRISYVGFQSWFAENCTMIDGCDITFCDETLNQTFDVVRNRQITKA